jgi:hypothetical protein
VGLDGVGWDDIASPVKLLQAKLLSGQYVVKRLFKSLQKICTVMAQSGAELERLTGRERSEKYERIMKDGVDGIVNPTLFVTQTFGTICCCSKSVCKKMFRRDCWTTCQAIIPGPFKLSIL